MSNTYMMNCSEVAAELQVSKSKAYQYIKAMNEELEKAGFLTVAGKIPRPFFMTRFFGYKTDL